MTQASAIRAARSTAASLFAANQMGGCGFCTGLATSRARVRWKYRPRWVTSSSVHSRLITSRALEKARDALLALDPECLVLLVAVAQPGAEDEAPLGDDVERRHLLGDVHRIEQRQQQHRRADPHRSGLGGQTGERGHRLDLLERRREVVLPHDDEVEPGVARRPHLVDVLAEALDHRHAGRMLLRDDQTEFHGFLPSQDCCVTAVALPILRQSAGARQGLTESAGRGYLRWLLDSAATTPRPMYMLPEIHGSLAMKHG